MASKKNKHPNTDPAALTLRVWVIEAWDRECGSRPNWRMFDVCNGDMPEWEAVRKCEYHSQHIKCSEFRYRAATLTFDDDGRKCVIY